jgi:sulfite exporter TauE/SafE
MQDLTHHIWIGFAGGILAFAHCLGMCGGFVLHLSQPKDGKTMISGQLLWQAGKLATYTFLGALAGFAGGYLDLLFLHNRLLQNLLTYTTGAIIILMGLSLLGLLPLSRKKTENAFLAAITSLGQRFFTASSPGAALTMGMATGFLPCPVVVAFLAYSLQSGSVVQGMATMAALSAGTMLPLLLLGGATRMTRLHLRSWGPTAGGIILVLLGLSTALRGTTAFHHLLGCPAKPALHQKHVEQSKPACTGNMHGNSVGN